MSTTARIVTDGEIATLARRQHELFTRFATKQVYADPQEILDCLQLLIEGKRPEIIPTVIEEKAADLKMPRTLDWWIAKAQEFAKEHLGVDIDLRAKFDIPAGLPWEDAIPVFDPGTLSNRDAFKLLKKLGLNPWEETDVMKYAGSEKSGKPTLHFIQNSKKPDEDTMDLSPNDLRKTGKSYLRLRGYALAMAVYNFATGEHLDPETFTWFPEDRLSGGSVAYGYWRPDYRGVRFYWTCPDSRHSRSGARVAMSVTLVS